MSQESLLSTAIDSPIEQIVQTRRIPAFTMLQLFVRAGGRCEFDGCNKSIMEHALTLQAGNFAEMAHIVAFKPDGPRGREGIRPEDINSASNLMLLCRDCHAAIDKKPMEFPRPRLEKSKIDHEARIAMVTDIGPDRKTATLVLKAPIGGQPISISDDQVFRAVLPRYPSTRGGTVIDLNDLIGIREKDEFLLVSIERINKIIDRFLDGGEGSVVGHLSILALGPIPLLVHAGARLSNKIPTDFFQFHRDRQDWVWKTDGEPAKFSSRLAREGAVDGPIAILLPLSGPIPLESLPEPIRSSGWLYELGVEGRIPDPTFLRLRDDLDAFRVSYQGLLGMIAQRHGLQSSVELIPAIPAPIAVACGRERLPKVHPALRVYDFDHAMGGYNYRIEVR